MRNQPYTCEDGAMPRPATGQTPKRNIRIGDDIWDPALERARDEGKTLTTVVKDYLATYGATGRPAPDEVDPWEVVNLVVREVGTGGVGPATDLDAAVAAASALLEALGVKSAPSR